MFALFEMEVQSTTTSTTASDLKVESHVICTQTEVTGLLSVGDCSGEKKKDKTMAKKSKFTHEEKHAQIAYSSYLLCFFLSLLSSTLINSITNIKISSKMSVATAKRSKHLTSVRGSTISQVHCLFRLCNGWLKVWKSWSRRSCSFLPLASVSDTTTEKGLSQINPNILLRYVASFRNSSGFLRN